MSIAIPVVGDTVNYSSDTSNSGDRMDFVIAGVTAFFLLGYLVYTLIHPERF